MKGSKMRKKRRFIVEELIETESKYCESLAKIVNCYFKPLRAAVGTRGEILTAVELKRIFANIETLLHLNQEVNYNC